MKDELMRQQKEEEEKRRQEMLLKGMREADIRAEEMYKCLGL